MIIINELEYVKNILECKCAPKNISNKRLLLYITKYYYNPEYSLKEMQHLVFEKMKEFNLSIDEYQEYKYTSYVKGLLEKIKSNELSIKFRHVDHVNLYKQELDIINKCESDKEKKVLFTLYILAKTNGTGSGWVNNEIKDIFQLANVTATNKDKALILFKLYKAGLISQSKKNDRLGYKVELCTTDDEIALTINNFENLGNQYISNFKDGWKMCVCCGKLFKVKSKNDYSSKYCKKCAVIVHNEKNKENMRKSRANKCLCI